MSSGFMEMLTTGWAWLVPIIPVAILGQVVVSSDGQTRELLQAKDAQTLEIKRQRAEINQLEQQNAALARTQTENERANKALNDKVASLEKKALIAELLSLQKGALADQNKSGQGAPSGADNSYEQQKIQIDQEAAEAEKRRAERETREAAKRQCEATKKSCFAGCEGLIERKKWNNGDRYNGCLNKCGSISCGGW